MKLLKILLALGLVITFIPSHFALASGTKTIDHYIPMDIDEEYWAFEEVDKFINADILDGYMDEDLNMTVQPENKITRAQFTKILVNALGLKNSGKAKTFRDVKPSDWYYEYVNTASSLGIISGKEDGRFAPNANITRDQMTKMIVLAFEKTVQFPDATKQKFTDVDSEYWAFEFVNKAAANGIVKGYGDLFKPRNLATRAQAIVMINRGLQQEQSSLVPQEEIIGFLHDHIKAENRLVETSAYKELTALYEKNAAGFYKAEAAEYGMAAFLMDDEEGTFTAEIHDEELKLEVISASDRFVTVEATGMIGTFVYKSQDFNMDFTAKMDGAYHLKLDSNSGTWKIYHYLPFFDEEELY
ncbi:S-layer homology domain-containing protein [Cytobacillus sp. NCCP-133]|uniref:S-layer homology domain-containing protein n=1 Tax=Cytobacillus sp. NCCP-133 TaxID=766848 RepID=UPI002230FDD0|nr:S-layer homology domain-containing protein [Cytobacillus sp. NCCP-133]GLB60233.1 hypothetical protein NCCP133_23650 [Cytobacillus sp. NCCP-133]